VASEAVTNAGLDDLAAPDEIVATAGALALMELAFEGRAVPDVRLLPALGGGLARGPRERVASAWAMAWLGRGRYPWWSLDDPTSRLLLEVANLGSYPRLWTVMALTASTAKWVPDAIVRMSLDEEHQFTVQETLGILAARGLTAEVAAAMERASITPDRAIRRWLRQRPSRRD
jgi:hypothetical protein